MMEFEFKFGKNDGVRVQVRVHSPVQNTLKQTYPNHERIQEILVGECGFDLV